MSQEQTNDLVLVDAVLIYIAEQKDPTVNYLPLIKEISPEDSKIQFYVRHHKRLKEHRHFLATQGVDLISTPPNWCHSKCSTSISMLSDIFIKAPEYRELILVSGSVDFTIAVQWLWNAHTVPTTVAVPKGIKVSKSLLQVARSLITLSGNESSSTSPV